MRELFEVAELLRIAVEDEKTGVAFYVKVADQVENSQLKKIFADLAEQEKHHQKRFEQMLQDSKSHAPKEQYAGEYTTYLRTLMTDRAFPDEAAAMQLAEQCEDDKAVVELATRFERDTLMLMNEMRGMVSDRNKDIVNEIIIEEQGHLVALAEAWQKLAG
ncbi:MAG: ferritin family protein [Phycisphaerae bacterium]|nr:ferritin family protein [Phycisphaerae bacterium]